LHLGPNGRFAPTAQGLEALSAVNQIDHTLALCMRRIAALDAQKAEHVSLGVVSTGQIFRSRTGGAGARGPAGS
jgi:hypothetical protein